MILSLERKNKNFNIVASKVIRLVVISGKLML